MITTLKTNWTKKIILAMTIMLTLFFAGPTIQVAYADEAPAPGGAVIGADEVGADLSSLQGNLSPDQKANLEDNVQTMQLVVNVLNKILWPVLMLTGGLMDNDLLFGNGMETRLRSIWIPIRNLVNILLVLILIGIALYNVLGIGGDDGNYSIKAMLPKIIIAIIAINFSFLGVKVVLDVTNVMTTAVFSIPAQIEGDNISISEETEKTLCAALSQDQLAAFQAKTEDQKIAEQNNAICRSVAESGNYLQEGAKLAPADTCTDIAGKLDPAKSDEYNKSVTEQGGKLICAGSKFTEHGQAYFSKYNTQNAAFVMALNMGNVLEFQKVDINSLKDFESLAINTVLAAILYVIYAISFVALFVVLLGRLLAMWAAVAASPVLVLFLIIPEIKDKIGGGGDLTDKFIKTAVAPIIIGFVMSMGWIMLKALRNVDHIAGISATQGVPVAGLNTLQHLIVSLATVAIVWVGVFAAAEGTVVQAATDWIKEQTSAAAKFVGKAAVNHVPVIPIKVNGQDGNYSLGQLGYALDQKLHTMSRPDGLYNATTSLKIKPLEARKIIDTASLKDTLKNSRQNYSHSELQELKGRLDSDWRTITKDLGTGGEDRNLRIALEQVKNAQDKTQLIAAGKALQEVRRKHSELKPNTQATNQPQNPAGTSPQSPQPSQIQANQDIKLPANNITTANNTIITLSSTEKNTIDEKLRAIDIAIRTAAQNPNAVNTEKSRITDYIKNIQDTIKEKGHTPTRDEIKQIIANSGISNLGTIMTDGEIDTALNPPTSP